jgi:S-adenosylmethionine decarboxylase
MSHHYENLTDMQQLVEETNGLSWMNDTTWTKLGKSQNDEKEDMMMQHGHPGFYSSMSSNHVTYRQHDETIEILMTRLDPEAMKAFYHKEGEASGLVGGVRVDQDTGLDQLYPEAKVDSFLFEPCGYSCNGLSNDGYYTIHVTPEPSCSYASFETTIPPRLVENPGKNGHAREESIRKLVRQVVDIFQPGSFTVTYFTSSNAKVQSDNINKLVRTVDQFGGYKRKDKILYEFEGYDFIFGHYTKI